MVAMGLPLSGGNLVSELSLKMRPQAQAETARKTGVIPSISGAAKPAN
jgi:hypothetical protein